MKFKLRWLEDNKSFATGILAVISVALMLYGLYIISPWYGQSMTIGSVETRPVAASMADRWEQVAMGLFFIALPLYTLYGIIRKKFRIIKSGSLVIFVVYVFAALLRLFVLGVFPPIWLFLLALGIIAGLCTLVLK